MPDHFKLDASTQRELFSEIDGEYVIPPSPGIDAAAAVHANGEVIGVNMDALACYVEDTFEAARMTMFWNIVDLYMIGVEPDYSGVYFNSRHVDAEEFMRGLYDEANRRRCPVSAGETLTVQDNPKTVGGMATFGVADREHLVDLRDIEPGQDIVLIGEYGKWLAMMAADYRGEQLPWTTADLELPSKARIARKYAAGMKDNAAEGLRKVARDIAAEADVRVDIERDSIPFQPAAKQFFDTAMTEQLGDRDMLQMMDVSSFVAVTDTGSTDALIDELESEGYTATVIGSTSNGSQAYIDGQTVEGRGDPILDFFWG
ncbi:MAG: hypothetical protein SV186_05275 [Candidatus Nanohaloarchaea archaeon]|nr:hypothetical protein [Candidatus Nanohaloarchaea archaeon]